MRHMAHLVRKGQKLICALWRSMVGKGLIASTFLLILKHRDYTNESSLALSADVSFVAKKIKVNFTVTETPPPKMACIRLFCLDHLTLY